MSKFLMVALMVTGLGMFGLTLRAEDKPAAEQPAAEQPAEGAEQPAGEGNALTGVLIDNSCGAKKNEEAAAQHEKDCALKEACAQSGFQLVVGEKHMKFDEAGNKLALEYLSKEDSTTRVTVEGTPSEDGMTLAVTSIKSAPTEVKKEGEGATQ